MKHFCLLAVAAAALVLAASSQARTSSHHRWYSMTLPERRAVVVREIRRQRAPIRRWFSSRSVESAAVYPLCRALGASVPGPVCAHGQRLVHALGVLRNIDAKIEARAEAERQAELARAHYAGWSCITNGAYPGAAHEGNGYNGSYTGHLGMTTPWLGHYPPGSDWVHSAVGSVYAIAESEAAQRGWAYSWMAGQWPRTFPPCAAFFR